MLNNLSWNNQIPACPVQATMVAADGPNGWALSIANALYYYTDSTQSWDEVAPPNGYAIEKISAGADTALLVIDTHGDAYQNVNGIWGPLPMGITHVGCGNSVNYVFGDSMGKFWRRFNSTLSEVTSTWISSIKQLATVPSMDHVWCIRDVEWDNVFYWGGDWVHVPGKRLVQLDVHQNSINNNFQVSGVDANGVGWMYNNLSGLWSEVPRVSFGVPFSSVETNDTYVWAVSNTGSSNNVFRGSFTPI